MIRTVKAGAAIHLLCLPTAFFALAACSQREPQPSAPKRDAEVMQLVESTKQNPSMTDPSKAGAPLNFDPYPKSGGMKHHSMEKHEEAPKKEAK